MTHHRITRRLLFMLAIITIAGAGVVLASGIHAASAQERRSPRANHAGHPQCPQHRSATAQYHRQHHCANRRSQRRQMRLVGGAASSLSSQLRLVANVP